MDEAPLLEQHENLHQQIKAFDRLLQHAMNKFSAKKMFQMLRASAYLVPSGVRDHVTGHVVPDLGTLRAIYDRLEMKKMDQVRVP